MREKDPTLSPGPGWQSILTRDTVPSAPLAPRATAPGRSRRPRRGRCCCVWFAGGGGKREGERERDRERRKSKRGIGKSPPWRYIAKFACTTQLGRHVPSTWTTHPQLYQHAPHCWRQAPQIWGHTP